MTERLATDETGTAGEITVLVTGFGPFQDAPLNPSYEKAKSLPRSITFQPSPHGPGKKTKVNILHLAGPVRTVYRSTLTLIGNILRTHAPDLVLHIGVAPERTYYAAERFARRLAHGKDDVGGQPWTPSDSDATWPLADGYPERLQPDLDLDKLWERWKGGCRELGGVDTGGPGGDTQHCGGVGAADTARICMSDEPGNYLCCFTYYTSLAWFRKMAAGTETSGNSPFAVERPVLFLHVPPCPEARDVERGREITEQLIRAMVGCWLDQKKEMAAAGGGPGLDETTRLPGRVKARNA